MGDPGYGPPCKGLERARHLAISLMRDLSAADDERRRSDLSARLAAARAQIAYCEGRLMVVSNGQQAICDVGAVCRKMDAVSPAETTRAEIPGAP
ncbi:hypothetical protein [Paramagnetospirillum magneticum]|uniref:Uncharacterized protein n=1 Tax=Paramagnetospirillum magneticum (strain ATCC 700264 / AMB-1) TaxID=342108 RepID=Q2W6S0_PARM1|nr:hypothetical protein [Paramagnetospirillum magneticum]BAE50455.1 hypothetical protein amb1651 [Paramagnetospirillum magneticum AMB-1]